MAKKKSIVPVIEKEARSLMIELFILTLIFSFSYAFILTYMKEESQLIKVALGSVITFTIYGGLYLLSWILVFLKHAYLTFIDAPIKKAIRKANKKKKKRRSFWSKIDWK